MPTTSIDSDHAASETNDDISTAHTSISKGDFACGIDDKKCDINQSHANSIGTHDDTLAVAEILQKFRQSAFGVQNPSAHENVSDLRKRNEYFEGINATDNFRRKRSVNDFKKESFQDQERPMLFCCNGTQNGSDENSRQSDERTLQQEGSKNVIKEVQDQYALGDSETTIQTKLQESTSPYQGHTPRTESPLISPKLPTSENAKVLEATHNRQQLPALYHIIHLGSGAEPPHASAAFCHGSKFEKTQIRHSLKVEFNKENSSTNCVSNGLTCMEVYQQFNRAANSTVVSSIQDVKLLDSLSKFQGFQSIRNPGKKACRLDGCSNSAAKRTPYCAKHTGLRHCEFPACSKCAQGQTRFCIAHGGGRRCTYPGCTKAARDPRYCAAHGGGRRCSETGCCKLAVGKSNLCTAHGGGRRCQAENCNKAAQSCSSYCVRHGGGKKCRFPGCAKAARGKTSLCMSHGRMEAALKE